MATGQRAETFGGLGLERRASLDFRGKLSAIEGYTAAIKDAQLRVTLMTQGLERLTEIAGKTRTDLSPPKFDPGPDGRTLAQVAAEDRLKLAIDILNSDLAGRHVFAGRAADKRPVLDYATIMNGDATRLGLKGMIRERLVADQGPGGLGRAGFESASAAGIESFTVQTADASRYGIKLVAVTVNMTNATAAVSSAAGNTTAQFDFTNPPAAGEGFTIEIALPDGTTQSLFFTAVAAGPLAPGQFLAGTTPVEARDNARTAVETAVATLTGSEDYKAASAIAAAREFFAQTPANPIPGGTYSRPVAFWYVGDDDTGSVPNGRDTAPVRADASYVVATGARANEAPLRNFMAQLGALAATSFTNDAAGRQAYEALGDKVRSNLAPADPAQRIESMVMELGAATVSMNAAKERHAATENVLQDALAQNEEAKPEAVAAAILALQTRLQASYQTTSILARLSIVNYL
jgi:flagellar hook-associated protein 3 FlgL